MELILNRDIYPHKHYYCITDIGITSFGHTYGAICGGHSRIDICVKIHVFHHTDGMSFQNWYLHYSLPTIVSSADNFYKQFGPSSGLTLTWVQTVDTLMVFLKEFFEKVDFEKSAS